MRIRDSQYKNVKSSCESGKAGGLPMKQVITIGNSEIPYNIRCSQKASRKRIVVTLAHIEVVVKKGTPDNEVEAFVLEHADEIFIAREELRQKAKRPVEESEQYFSGGKITFRGRRLAVRVERHPGSRTEVIYRNSFYVHLPESTPQEDEEAVIRDTMIRWMKRRVRDDAREIAREYGAPLGLAFQGIRIKEQKNIWATCGRDGILHLNWHLVRLPRKALEYAVVHELAHLKHRNHSQEFWNLVEKMMPGWREYAGMMDGG